MNFGLSGGPIRGAPSFILGGDTSPLLRNLQFFADYENWTAGDPLPNRYPDNSGITSLADNNTVGKETLSPLIEANSGDYTATNSEYHGGSIYSALDTGGVDVYISGWMKMDDITNRKTLLSTIDGSNSGLMCRWEGNSSVFRLIGSTGTFKSVEATTFGAASVGTTYFVEGWYTESDTTLHIRINNGAVDTESLGSTLGSGSGALAVGARGDLPSEYMSGQLDSVAIEIAPPGELKWPSESTWLYNSGAGRSWSEIQNYNP